MRRGLLIWLSGIGAVAATYAELDRRYEGWTFCTHLRPWAREHPLLFTAGCAAVSGAFYLHIFNGVEGSLST
jgi:hypothetical protein